uniref:BRICHOS domain containing 5 n=1 Tax=Sinocyclocheilus anshuiensis TaxID=1608454 RepID=A0A671RDK9_9TELE
NVTFPKPFEYKCKTLVLIQSALIDKHNSVVTYSVTSHANHTSTVIFDTRHGLVCYKPDNQDSCFLRRMERLDYENVQSQLNKSEQQVKDFCLLSLLNRTSIMIVIGTSIEIRTLRFLSFFPEGPRKQRLIYFCIDICFPSNICVSVCFYYLPE